ncbi:MAG: MBL fold metallo-hydrolase [Anaerolineae bacterium]|nr:MBL fold metallo-hydrolase [Anaerolineae bacterium]
MQIQIGNVTVHHVLGENFRADGGGHFGLVPKVLWQRIASTDESNRVSMVFHGWLIESAGRRILVDTGHGTKLDDKFKRHFAVEEDDRLLVSLAAIGVSPQEVDIVINTHLHADHCGGNTRRQGDQIVAAFPNAEYWVQRLEYADALFPNERTRATYLAENFRPLEESGQLRLLYGDTRVTPEVRCLVTRGHTRAHQCVVIESEGQAAICLGDLAPWAVHFERLAWVPAYDVEPLETIETKRRVRDWALETGAILLFDHDPRMAAGILREEDGCFKVEPI